MTKAEIKGHITRLQNGRAATNDAHQIELIDLGLKKYRNMLSELEKKSEQQAIQKPKEIPEKTIQQAHKDAQKHVENRVSSNTLAPTIAAPKPRQSQTVNIQLVKGEREMDLAQIETEARRYFSLVLTSATFQKGGNILTMDMGCNLIAFYTAWTWFKDGENPDIFDLLPGYKRYSTENQNKANELLDRLKQELQ